GNEISTNPDLTIEINGERNLTANFSINTYTVSGFANPEEGGWISGLGTFEYGDFAYLIATANEGYTFINWTEDGNEISTNPNLTIEINGERNLTANFLINTYTVSASANPAEGGTIIGTGAYTYGENANLTAIP